MKYLIILLLLVSSPCIADDTEKLRLTDQHLLPVLVNAIQELNAKFEAYKVSHP